MERTTQRQLMAVATTLMGIVLLLVCLCALMLDWEAIYPGRTCLAATAFIAIGVVTNARQERRIKSKGHR
jgi:CHASE2 domain-containing sensor protein